MSKPSTPPMPDTIEIALREAGGYRLIRTPDARVWVKDCTLTVGGVTLPIEPARIIGTDGADTPKRTS